MLRPLRRAALAALTSLALPACGSFEISERITPEPSAQLREIPNVGAINGYAYFIDHLMYDLSYCIDPSAGCPPPTLLANSPFVLTNLAFNAKVTVSTMADRTVLLEDTKLTGYDGVFTLAEVPIPESKLVYLSTKTVTGAPLPPGPPPPINWAPLAPAKPTFKQLPSATAIPIGMKNYNCTNQQAVVFTDTGIVPALAISEGRTIADLLNPTKTGGVLVFVNRSMPEIAIWSPLIGSVATTDVGTLYGIGIAPDGALPPGFQSKLGFYADPSGISPVGIYAVVLPPTTAPFTHVTITPQDLMEDPTQGRPYPFLPVPPIAVRPGEITYAQAYPGLGPPMALGSTPITELCIADELYAPPAPAP